MGHSHQEPDRQELLTREEMDRIDIEDARAALKEAEEKGTVPLRELMRELGD
jgi:hypothetical protein